MMPTTLLLAHRADADVAMVAPKFVFTCHGSILFPYAVRGGDLDGGDIDRSINANARIQVELLHKSSTVIREGIENDKLKVEAGVYDLATGKVSLNLK
jgi:hypothetical protein